MRKPNYFAAASPQSCRGDPNTQRLSELVDSAIWSMCGTADSYFTGAQAMADAMKSVGAREFIFTPFQGVGHSIHNLGYDYPGFIDWMFAQSLPAVADAGATDCSGGRRRGARQFRRSVGGRRIRGRGRDCGRCGGSIDASRAGRQWRDPRPARLLSQHPRGPRASRAAAARYTSVHLRA